MHEKLKKPYDPKATEERIYKLWEESGFFNPDKLPPLSSGQAGERKEVFTIMMPPPNVTGVLHMGHALMITLEDIMIRYKRMRGFKTLWLPGTDHAAIATQSRVEKDIQKKEGKSRHDLGREEMLKRINDFALQSHDTIVSQIKVMGASCDWSREAFTLDEKRNVAVNTIFKKMYDDGLIYRGNRIVNWDPKGQTTISDDEIVYEERTAKLYTFKYAKDFPISISTTRPETKIGDVAVAVHPDDKRYTEFVGKEYDLEFCGVPVHIKIIADKEVDPEFGTGALGVTPAHSMIDWEMADRHNLPRPQVINEYAKISVGDERLLGKKTIEAREVIVEWLRSENLLEKEEEVKQNISTAERTGGIIEPLPKLQWFINVNKPIKERGEKTLKDLMREPFEKEEIKIIPDYFSKTYFHWIENLRDWCISRQIWYGHRVPVWYDDKNQVYCGVKAPEGNNWKQDEDTLDTWFSSGLWTFSTLGWPEKTKDLETYHPTDVLETGYEILFFWVARMVLMSEYALGVIPFKNVFLHGTVRDAKGRKMSKSLNNGIDPLDIADKFGADAGRMALVVGTAPGTDSKISEDKIKGYKNFSNKIWNITRFILDNVDENSFGNIAKNKLTKEFSEVVEDLTSDMENYRFHLASEKIYQYVWHRFADEIIEESKEIIKLGDKKAQERKETLVSIWVDCLKILHPFIPFVTEEIWSMMPVKDKNLLMVEKWPS
ncbi:valine--tRNA ligase [Candidatus Nomurabacteria bacterium GWB1_40_6]|uniref:Valine--tRNA ligase n=1 Tax=Candidatus Nomurabacteria bacterium GWB1_40_6 TaxID=1801727 RepID=A0A1F6TM86_9BACT|nr:MAG: valine--tRNA ligase [Candidatus Nomurabacteria bacterium GWB1_40_6]